MNIQLIIIVIILGSIIAITTLFITLFQTINQVRQLTKQQAIQKIISSTDTIQYPPPFSDEVVILRKEIVYEYLADGVTIYQRKRMQIQNLQQNLKSFKDRYRWTGSGDRNIKSITPGYIITNQKKGEEGIWDYFEVEFPHPLSKGGVADFTIEWKLTDKENKALTFLSTMIDRETKYLLLQVNLPDELAPKRAYFHEYAHYIDTLPIYTEPVVWSQATKAITREVSQPVIFHKYMIRWYRE